MTAHELIAQLQEKGVELKSSGDRLVIDAPKGTITPEIRSALAEHKADLLVILSQPAVPEPRAASQFIEAPVERASFSEPRPAPAGDSSAADEIKQLETELMRLRAEEEGRRAEVEAAQLAHEHALGQDRQRWRALEEQAARKRSEEERLRIEAEARERAAEETRRRIAEEELARVEEELT